jgi:hypothetical protein
LRPIAQSRYEEPPFKTHDKSAAVGQKRTAIFRFPALDAGLIALVMD